MHADSRKWLGLLAVSLGVSVIVIDTTIVNVIVPSLIDDLGIDAKQTQWVQESYAIVFAAVLLLAGRLSDLWGARRAFLSGLLIFGAASIAAAAALNGGMLIAARFAQGFGGAFMLPSSLTLINATFTGADRGKAFAIWGSTIGAGAAIGPLLGGWLDGYTWRLVFGINIAVVIVVVFGVRASMDSSPRTRGDVDKVGAVLSVVGLGLLAFGLIEGRTYGWLQTRETLSLAGIDWTGDPSPVFVALVLALLALTLLVWRQVRLTRTKATTPLVDVELFRIRSFGLGNVATLLIGIGEFGVIAIIPLWLQFALGYSAVQAGLALAALAVGSFGASGASFALQQLTAVSLVRIGLALEIIGLVILGLVAADDTTWWEVGGALFVYGMGVGFATAQVTNVVLIDVPEASAGSASGVQSAVRQVGSALGIAVLTTVFYTSFASGFDDRLAERIPNAPSGISRRIVDNGGAALPALERRARSRPIARAGQQAMGDAVSTAGYLSAVMLLVGLLATTLIGAPRRASDATADPATGGARHG